MDWFKCLPSSSWYSCKWLKAFLTAAAQQQPFTSVLKQKPGVPACRLFPALEKVLCTCAALHVSGVVPLFELSLSVRCHNRCHGGCTPGQPLSTCAAASVGSGAPADWLCGSVDFLLSRRESAAPLPAPPPNQQTGSCEKAGDGKTGDSRKTNPDPRSVLAFCEPLMTQGFQWGSL